jgi:hypothetical protein
MRLVVAKVIQEKLKTLDINYPKSSNERQAELTSFIEIINQQNAE